MVVCQIQRDGLVTIPLRSIFNGDKMNVKTYHQRCRGLHGGKIIGLDINPYAGRYLAEPYSSVVDLVLGDSLEFLRDIRNEIDVFIHDSEHSREHESREYELVGPKLSKNGVIVSDNAEVTDCLYEFALKNSMVFSHWGEEVINHVASPGGIALAVSISAKVEKR